MEHLTELTNISKRTGIDNEDKLLLLIKYAKAIYTENQKYNLTGHKTLSEIIENLIIGSLEPVKGLNVPRGTLFADIGTGAGIPGVPLSIKYDDSRSILFDSNQKKIRFINKTTSAFEIRNVQGVDLRVEDAGRSAEYREKFDLVVTRAMSDIYTISEVSAPLAKTGGFIFLFANKDQINLDDYQLEHLSDIGLSANVPPSSLGQSFMDLHEGLLLVKLKNTDDKYPRRMPVIKRMSSKQV